VRAMIIPECGGPDLFEETDVKRPGPGEVLVRVFASSVNPVDTKLRADGGPSTER
jgi:NADPH2:quinone reductase